MSSLIPKPAVRSLSHSIRRSLSLFPLPRSHDLLPLFLTLNFEHLKVDKPWIIHVLPLFLKRSGLLKVSSIPLNGLYRQAWVFTSPATMVHLFTKTLKNPLPEPGSRIFPGGFSAPCFSKQPSAPPHDLFPLHRTSEILPQSIGD
jgi:hypothetical protein